MNHKKVLALLALASLSGCGIASADEKPMFALPDVTVTATRQAEDLADVPAHVQVITEKQIKERNVQTTADAVAMATGVSTTHSVEGTVNLRGYSAKNLLVLVDGQQVNTAWNGDVDWNMIPVETIRKIEIVSGGQSALYGGRAVGGVVNIMTKTPRKDGAHGSVVVSYGSHGTTKQSYSVSGKKNKFLFGAFYESKQTSGWRDYDVFISKSGPVDGYASSADGNAIIGQRGKKQVLSENYGFTLGYAFSDDKKLTYKYTHSLYNWTYSDPVSYMPEDAKWSGSIGSGTYKFTSFLGNNGWRTYDMHSLTYNDQKNKLHAHFGMVDYTQDGYISASKVDETLEGTGSKSSYPNRSWDFDLNKRWTLGDHNVLVGASYGQDRFDQTLSTVTNWKDWDSKETAVTQKLGGKDKYWALYAQDKWEFAPKWTAYIGGRYDHYTKYDGYDTKEYEGKQDVSGEKSYSQFSPKLALDYAVNDSTNVYVSYGKSFSSPILYQLYRYSEVKYGDKGKTYPNPALKPETTDTWELGVKKKLGNKTNLSADIFFADTKDYIHLNKEDSNHKFYENAGDAKKHGFEIALTQRHSDRWTSYFNYTWETGTIEGEKDYDIPRHLIHLGTAFHRDPWTVNLDGTYISDRTEAGMMPGHFKARDSYFLLNLNTHYKLRQDLSLQFSIDNLLDKEYYDEDIATSHYYIGAGRTYTLTARYDF